MSASILFLAQLVALCVSLFKSPYFGSFRHRLYLVINTHVSIELLNIRDSVCQLWSKSTNAENQIVIKKKGRMTFNGKTPDNVWMHPFLFIDFAMWLNPTFKYDVIKFVYDELINYRNEAGDAYREMAITIVMRKFRQ